MCLTFPRLYLIRTHLSDDELTALDESMVQAGIQTFDVTEAELFIGKLSQATRAKLELRRLGLNTDEFGRADDAGEEVADPDVEAAVSHLFRSAPQTLGAG